MTAEDQAALMPQVVTWSQIEQENPRWAEAYEATRPDEAHSHALAQVPAGAEVTVVLATWCGDSRREVPRFMRAIEIAGVVPFTVRLLDVPKRFRDDPAMQALDIRFVPTFIVRRDGQEVGRVVESSPAGVERDVGALLRGEASGVISGRSDL